MKLAAREVYQTAVGLVTAECHVDFGPAGAVKYIYRADIGDRTIEGWGADKAKAKLEFERTLEKWLSDGAP